MFAQNPDEHLQLAADQDKDLRAAIISLTACTADLASVKAAVAAQHADLSSRAGPEVMNSILESIQDVNKKYARLDAKLDNLIARLAAESSDAVDGDDDTLWLQGGV